MMTDPGPLPDLDLAAVRLPTFQTESYTLLLHRYRAVHGTTPQDWSQRLKLCREWLADGPMSRREHDAIARVAITIDEYLSTQEVNR